MASQSGEVASVHPFPACQTEGCCVGDCPACLEIVRLRAELETERADAARYRFLRDNPYGFGAVDGNAGAAFRWPMSAEKLAWYVAAAGGPVS